jgi:4-amino-4-deoxy-L-arabinose transferase-like glycosyltransferase
MAGETQPKLRDGEGRLLDRWSWAWAVVVVLAVFVFLMAGMISERVFERLPHLEDELAYLYQAKIFAGGQIVIDSPDNHRAFWQPFVIDYEPTGKRFGKYPPGWPALLAFGVAVGGPWLINAVFGALTIILVFWLGREIWGAWVGALAALLTAFSPAALLLNATLMAHTAALFFATLFIVCWWRLEQPSRRISHALAAGAALGALFIVRPLSAVAVGLPFMVWGGALMVSGWKSASLDNRRFRLRSAAILIVAAGLVGSALPLFNAVATGSPTTDLYRLVWSYDRLGFGEGHGRTGHTIANGLRHAGFDLSLASADLYGWQPRGITPELVEHLQTGRNTWPARAYSFALLPCGLLVGLLAGSRQRGDLALRLRLFGLWCAGAFFWTFVALRPTWFLLPSETFQQPGFSWLWILVALVWANLPLLALVRWRDQPEIPWTWLLFAATLNLLILNMTYWTGSMRYSTRYYFEVLTAVSLLSAVPAILATSRRARGVMAVVAVALSAASFIHYSYPRIGALYRFNEVGRDVIDDVQAMRTSERPILVLVSGDTGGQWQPYGALMAVTGPYLDGDIIAARIGGDEDRAALSDRFRERQVIELRISGVERELVEVDLNPRPSSTPPEP